MKFIVGFEIKASGEVIVEAESAEEAEEQVDSMARGCLIGEADSEELEILHIIKVGDVQNS